MQSVAFAAIEIMHNIAILNNFFIFLKILKGKIIKITDQYDSSYSTQCAFCPYSVSLDILRYDRVLTWLRAGIIDTA